MPIVLLVAAALVLPAPTYDLLQIEHLAPKGRVQDHDPEDPVVTAIVSSGRDAIPVLIRLIESERVYEETPIDFWPLVREGDVAFAILSDLFLDPTWKKSTLPDLCWDNILERTSSDLPAWQVLEDFVATHGRAAIAEKWRSAWSTHQADLEWDEAGRFFRVAGRELAPCRITTH